MSGEPADELGDQAELGEVLGTHLQEEVLGLALGLAADLRGEAERASCRRRSMMCSSPAKAPPTTNRMFVVSIWMNS